MEHSKKRHITVSSQADYWYHGTSEYFDAWTVPTIPVKANPDLHPHPFVCLTKNIDFAQAASESSGGLCRAKLKKNTRVLDLTKHSNDNIKIWKDVKASKIGIRHAYTQNYDLWLEGCRSGGILRFAFIGNDELGLNLERLMQTAFSQNYPDAERAQAALEVHNFTRSWINDVIGPARRYGFQAVICNEIDTHHPQGNKTYKNLHVFDVSRLTVPEWVSMPKLTF